MDFPKFSRRQAIASTGAAWLTRLVTPCRAAMQDETAGQLVAGKDPRLVVLKKFPAVLETPLELLAESSETPNSLLFVRNNQQPETAATLAPPPQTSWSVTLDGGLSRTFSVSLSRLREMEQTEYQMVLQCSGNSRSLFSRSAPTSGTQWGRGGMGNVRFSGVRLSHVLEKHGVEVNRGVRFVNASGVDEPLPGKEDFLHSLPIDDVLNRSILALDLNGRPLPAIHGGPVRLITPGVYATMHMKWLNRLQFTQEESDNYNHLPRYRVPQTPISPGSDFDFTFENSRFNWNMKVKSVLLSPGDGAQLQAGTHLVKGVAFNDGRTRITGVYLSFDHGASWRQAKLKPSDSLYGWTQFEMQRKLAAGMHPIWCRAIDAYGRSQPADGSIAWNPRGYEWNGVEKISVHIS